MVRRQASELITRLKVLGLNLVILSGDQMEPVRTVADELQFANAKAKLALTDKLGQLQQRQQNGETVAVVGDGVNHVPVRYLRALMSLSSWPEPRRWLQRPPML